MAVNHMAKKQSLDREESFRVSEVLAKLSFDKRLKKKKKHSFLFLSNSEKQFILMKLHGYCPVRDYKKVRISRNSLSYCIFLAS